MNLKEKQIVLFKQAYEWAKLPTPKYPCLGRSAKTKDGKAFVAPFAKQGLIHPETLKYTGVFRLTEKGMKYFEENYLAEPIV